MNAKQIRRPIGAALLCGFAAAALVTGCSIFPREEQMMAPPLLSTPSITYDTVKVTRSTIESDVTGSGSLVSVSQKEYSFQYSGGVLASIRVRLGDTVRAGDVLASLYTDSLDNQIEQQQLTVKQAQLALDDANADLADNEAKDPTDSKGDKRRLSSAAQNALFALQKQQLSLDQLNKQKQRSTITADVAGQVVYIAAAGAGTNVSAFQTLVTVADTSRLQVRFSGDDLSSFADGAAVSLAWKDQSLSGQVVATPADLPVAATASGSQQKPYVQIRADGLPAGASIGDSVTVKLVKEKKDNVLTLPINCVHQQNGSHYVNTLDKNGLRVEKNVETGIQSQTDIEIVKGLDEGESVIP